jgi:homoserine dehydrogenase
VVTANKALLAQHGDAIFDAARDSDVDVYYEAAVAGAIPIIRPLRESLVGDAITSVLGIVNGTTNYILDQMHTASRRSPTRWPRRRRWATPRPIPPPTSRATTPPPRPRSWPSLAFHTRVTSTMWTARDHRHRRGRHRGGGAAGLRGEAAGSLLGLADGTVAVGVHPTMVPLEHPLAGIRGAYNAVFVESVNAGRLMFMGPGAGGSPTASAVLGDIVTAARNRVRGVAGPGESAYSSPGHHRPGRRPRRATTSPSPCATSRACLARGRGHGAPRRLDRRRAAGTAGRGRLRPLGVTTHEAPTTRCALWWHT